MCFYRFNFSDYFRFLASYLRLARVRFMFLFKIAWFRNIRVRYFEHIYQYICFFNLIILFFIINWYIIYRFLVVICIAQWVLTHKIWSITLKIIEIYIKLLGYFTNANWTYWRIKYNFFFKLRYIWIMRCKPWSFS